MSVRVISVNTHQPTNPPPHPNHTHTHTTVSPPSTPASIPPSAAASPIWTPPPSIPLRETTLWGAKPPIPSFRPTDSSPCGPIAATARWGFGRPRRKRGRWWQGVFGAWRGLWFGCVCAFFGGGGDIYMVNYSFTNSRFTYTHTCITQAAQVVSLHAPRRGAQRRLLAGYPAGEFIFIYFILPTHTYTQNQKQKCIHTLLPKKERRPLTKTNNTHVRIHMYLSRCAGANACWRPDPARACWRGCSNGRGRRRYIYTYVHIVYVYICVSI